MYGMTVRQPCQRWSGPQLPRECCMAPGMFDVTRRECSWLGPVAILKGSRGGVQCKWRGRRLPVASANFTHASISPRLFLNVLLASSLPLNPQTLAPVGEEWEHLGNLGPVIYGSVGDVVRIVFRNNLGFPVNMAPSGGLTTWASSSNSNLKSEAFVAPVKPGQTVTYLWTIPEEAGPAPNATVSSRLWMYRSTVDPYLHDNAGLLGSIIVTGKGMAGPTGRATDVDREIVTVFQVCLAWVFPWCWILPECRAVPCLARGTC